MTGGNARKKQGKTIVTAISGASGAIYGVRLVKALVEHRVNTLVILSSAAKMVLNHEMGLDPKETFKDFLVRYGVDISGSNLEIFSQDEIGGPPASGSFVHHGMAVAPCSMKTLSAVASGYADNLITRACDVCLKEHRTLVMVPRETPFNIIHLENMTRVARAGAVILPPSPSFYSSPQCIEDLVDTVIARILDHLAIEHDLMTRWAS